MIVILQRMDRHNFLIGYISLWLDNKSSEKTCKVGVILLERLRRASLLRYQLHYSSGAHLTVNFSVDVYELVYGKIRFDRMPFVITIQIIRYAVIRRVGNTGDNDSILIKLQPRNSYVCLYILADVLQCPINHLINDHP